MKPNTTMAPRTSRTVSALCLRQCSYLPRTYLRVTSHIPPTFDIRNSVPSHHYRQRQHHHCSPTPHPQLPYQTPSCPHPSSLTHQTKRNRANSQQSKRQIPPNSSLERDFHIKIEIQSQTQIASSRTPITGFLIGV